MPHLLSDNNVLLFVHMVVLKSLLSVQEFIIIRKMLSRMLILVIIGVCLNITTSTATKKGIRGLNSSRLPLYQPTIIGDSFYFRCLSTTHEKIIPYSYINDNYCDCNDGSDEPGTSACSPNGDFFCENINFIEKYISTAFVDDGFCDCCDGSDEAVGLCENDCQHKSDKLYQQNQEMFEKFANGKKLRVSYLEKGYRDMGLMNEKLEKLKTTLIPTKLNYEQCQEMKLAMEEKLVVATDDNNDYEPVDLETATDKNEFQADDVRELFGSLDQNNDGFITDKEFKIYPYLKVEEKKILKTFYEENILNVQNDDELYDKYTSSIHKPVMEHILTVIQTHKEYPKKISYVENEDNYDEVEETYDEIIEDDLDNNNTEVDDIDVTKSVDDRLDEIRKKCEDVRLEVEKIEKEIKDTDSFIKIGFGENNVFLPLRDYCHNLHTNEYVYTICPFDKVQQEVKHSNEKVTLGYWNRWQNNYSEMFYDRGQKCWNGPDRTVRVQLHCGLQDQLIDVSEPSRCEYLFIFETPASCDSNMDFNRITEIKHEEL